MQRSEQTIQAIGVSPGIAIGRVLRVKTGTESVAEIRYVQPDEVEGEIERLNNGIEKTKAQLESLRNDLKSKLSADEVEIFSAHMQILEDKMLYDDIAQRIRGENLSAENAIRATTERFVNVFMSMPDEHFRERAVDVKDILSRLIATLQERTIEQISGPGDKRIVVAHSLTPSETVRLDPELTLGFVVSNGSATSHTAILARSLQLPALVGVPVEVIDVLKIADTIIIDGYTGKMIVNPTGRTEETYRTKIRSTGELIAELEGESSLRPRTKDGFEIELAVNLEKVEDYDKAKAAGACGVGLYRTEFLFMDPYNIPGEDEQFEIYKKLLIAAGDSPVTIRTMDIGGDKLNSAIFRASEANPFLGLRGIRLSLYERRDLFETQLRALLRAGIYGNLRVMLPMVSSIREVMRTRSIIGELQEALGKENKEHLSTLSLGIMIETPAAAMMADKLAGLVDFFSIGTNDLVQYTMAIDRGNERVAYLYQPGHPAILRLIGNVVEAARANNIFVGVCGQMSGDPLFTPVLLGLGVSELSMPVGSLAAVRRVIRSISLYDAEKVTAAALDCSFSGETQELFRKLLDARAPEISGIRTVGKVSDGDVN